MAILKGNSSNNTIEGAGDNDALFGFAGSDTLIGNGGDDLLIGGDNTDVLIGGMGNDFYFVESAVDKVIELRGEGVDTVRSSANWTLGRNIENLTLTGSAAYGTGNALANHIKGNGFANTLDGGLGADMMAGGEGNDDYYVTAGDKVIEWVNAGMDHVRSGISWTLGRNFEVLTLFGDADTDGTGNALDNNIWGNTGNNVLDGKGGVDTLYSFAGDDTLKVRFFDGINSTSVSKELVSGGIGNDKLVLTGADNQIDLQHDKVYGIETIDLTGSGVNSLLNVSANAVAKLSDTDVLIVNGDAGDTLKLSNEGGVWTDNGIVNGSHSFSSGASELIVDAAVTVVAPAEVLSTYTISDADTAANVSGFFSADEQKVVIDFGGKAYRDAGVSAIDLTGFGLEDILVIAQHDGALNGSAIYGSKSSNYITEYGITVSYSNSISDKVSWKMASTKAVIHSKDMHYTGNNHGTGSSSSYSFPVSITGNIQLTGLPAGLPEAQFVFV